MYIARTDINVTSFGQVVDPKYLVQHWWQNTLWIYFSIFTFLVSGVCFSTENNPSIQRMILDFLFTKREEETKVEKDSENDADIDDSDKEKEEIEGYSNPEQQRLAKLIDKLKDRIKKE